ncbi:ribophorin i [Lichtheimia corymbifera JMRC:FSU:9682]|uniref:Dolichyl-diphosphooligosaccharide--protein glycosyltransferase subunit 1 n=1 Tax=Lichtheimia corymbifera JMRC:FSU:9682 TaxID=1263082 RepID=A0A068SHA2_9FUNG|nr:ribophorin i [Lichtheimia corymbifera JMRC:FSU:9682]
MRFSVVLLSILVLGLIVDSGQAFLVDSAFRNTRLVRVIDLRGNVVHHDIGIRARNIDSQPMNEYLFTVSSETNENIADIKASLLEEPRTALTVEPVLEPTAGSGWYKVVFDKPIEPDTEIRFGIKIAYTHVLENLPASIKQLGRQYVYYSENIYVDNPYFTDEIKTTLHLPAASRVLSYTGGPQVERIGDKIVYGPYLSVTPGSYNPFRIHYEYSKPLLTVTELQRDIQVSHWASNLAVEEHYKLEHSGARLEEEFNRAMFQKTRMVHDQTNVLKTLTFELPAAARDVYYRDEIGNVSTSRLSYGPDKATLQLFPRYPLYGGWIYTWFHGYNVDASQFVRYSSKSGRYILNLNFVENVQDMVIDKAELRVVLPEGAKNVQVEMPFGYDNLEHAVHYTNFDSTGRYVVVIQKHNVVREHQQPIQITYDYPSSRLLQKPLVASAAIFILFLASILFSRLSLSIEAPAKKSQ